MSTRQLNTLISFIFLSTLTSGCNNSSSSSILIEEPGKITEQVRCVKDTSLSYTLYVPSSYQKEKKWPVLLCFDPHAEGLLPVRLFKEQAEKYGFILAASNNSKNGMSPAETNLICKTVLSDLTSTYSTDSKAIYLAGFSGGARVAGSFALNEGNIAGIIAIGAGLPAQNPQQDITFSYLSIAGTWDFNYTELHQLDKKLEATGTTHYLLEYDGPHAWPPSEIVPQIFTWLEFDRMRKGTVNLNRVLINQFIDDNFNLADSARKNKDFVTSYKYLVKMRQYLEGLTDLTPLNSEIDRVITEPSFIAAQQRNEQILSTEINLQSQYSLSIQSEQPDWWMKESQKLRSASEKLPQSDETHMYKRLLGFLSLNAYSLSNRSIRQGNLEMAFHFVELYSIIDPSNSEHRYLAALILIQQGQKKEALNALEDAFQLGFKDYSRLNKEPAFKTLVKDPEYIRITKSH